MAKTGGDDWGLEVVRGRDVGRVFPLAPGSNVLGNSLNGGPGLDLGGQEGASPRRMAARQATVDRSAVGLSVTDLESPGGTFVNRQRILPGQARRLEPGDVIQVGAVQLRVVGTGATAPPQHGPGPIAPAPTPPPSAKPSPRFGALSTPFKTRATAATCRTWDDFLTLSAKNWTELSEELQSGRLGAFLKAAGRDDLVPPPVSSKTPDERLDEWLGRLPTTRPAEPDLEVYPSVVRVRGPAGGGTVRSRVVITNTGYRLLRSSLRLEPPETDWVRLPPTFTTGTFTTAESTAVPFDVEIPEALSSARSAALVIDSNGGSRRVEVRVEIPAKPDPLPGPGVDEGPFGRTTLRDLLAGRRLGLRVLFASLALIALRALVTLGDLLARAAGVDRESAPSLAGGAVVMAVAGGVAAGRLAGRRGEPRDVPAAAFAGAFAGVLVAALSVAVCRAFETERNGGRPLEFLILLGSGVIAALVSLRLVPYEPTEGGTP